MSKALNVWHNNYDWYVAGDKKDLRKAVEEMLGKNDAAELFEDPDVWGKECPDDDILIWCDATGDIGEGGEGICVIGTAAVWAEVMGRGFFCSTEW